MSEVIHLVQKTKELCADYGIKLHRFASNSPEVLEMIPSGVRAKYLENVALDNNINTEAVERILGIEWCNCRFKRGERQLVIFHCGLFADHRENSLPLINYDHQRQLNGWIFTFNYCL